MKKLVCCLMVLLLLTACGGGSSGEGADGQEPEILSGEPTALGFAQAWDGRVYATGQFDQVPGWEALPVDAYMFAIYADGIYYLDPADLDDTSEEKPLYRCDLDGGKVTRVTDNVFVGVTPQILNGYLVYISNGIQGEDEESAGLYRLNLATGEKELFHQGMYYTILGRDDSRVYYRAYEEVDGGTTLALYRMDPVTGEREGLDVDAEGGFVYDGYIFVPSAEELLRIDPEAPEQQLSISVIYDELGGLTVHEGWIYYSDGANVCRVSVDGGAAVLCPLGEETYWASNFFVVDGYVYFYETVEAGGDGMNTLFSRVPLAGGERETLFTLYV